MENNGISRSPLFCEELYNTGKNGTDQFDSDHSGSDQLSYSDSQNDLLNENFKITENLDQL